MRKFFWPLNVDLGAISQKVLYRHPPPPPPPYQNCAKLFLYIIMAGATKSFFGPKSTFKVQKNVRVLCKDVLYLAGARVFNLT